MEEFGDFILLRAASFPGNRLGRVDARFESAELQKKFKKLMKFCFFPNYYPSRRCLMSSGIKLSICYVVNGIKFLLNDKVPYYSPIPNLKHV